MKKNLFLGMAALAMAATSFITTACDSLGDLDVTNPNQTAQDASWLEQFGEIDDNQDWSLATTASATISVYGIDALSDYQLQLYTANPIASSEALLIASKAVTTDANGNASVSFDAVDVLEGQTIYYACYKDRNNRRCVKPVSIVDGTIKAQFGIPASSSAKAMRKTVAETAATLKDVADPTDEVNAKYNQAKELNSTNATVNDSGNSNYATVLKISGSWNGNISVLASEGAAARTLYVDGTWTLGSDGQTLGGNAQGTYPTGGLIVVRKGGKIVIPSGSSLKSANGGRIVVLTGGSVEGSGSITFCNGSADSYDYIAAGATVNVGVINNNGGKLYNYGTVIATELRGGAGNSIVVNRNSMTIDHTTEGDTSANLRIYTCCHFEVTNNFYCRNLYMYDPSYAHIGGNLKMSCSEDGTDDPTQIVMEKDSRLVVVGEVSLNKTNIVGPTAGGAICEFGKIGSMNYAPRDYNINNPVTEGYVINNIYISIDQPDSKEDYYTPSSYTMFTHIMMNGHQYNTYSGHSENGTWVVDPTYADGVQVGDGNAVIVTKGQAPIYIPESNCGSGSYIPAYYSAVGSSTVPASQNFIFACEDLGSTQDMDFNDIVFSVGHVAGSTEMTITPLAAGGTLPANIWYDGTKIGEIHEMLGEGDFSKMLNTTSKGVTANGTPITVDVAADWTFAKNVDKFLITVQKDENKATRITAPTTGTAPFMIVLPSSWQWPVEYTNIGIAYPKFVNWSQDANALNWYESPTEGKIVNR